MRKTAIVAVIVLVLSGLAGAADFLRKSVSLNGRLITAEDPLAIGTNFQDLQNMRYTDTHIKGVAGMTKINSAAPSTYFKARNAFHYDKDVPTSETHVLAQEYNTGLTASQVLQNTTAIPSAGAFSGTALWTDSSGAGRGYFTDTPNGMLAYANGEDVCLWGGDEAYAGAFINYNPDGTFKYDYSEEIRNARTDANNVATLHKCAAGIDSDTMLMCHFDNALTDNSPTTPHTVEYVTTATSDSWGIVIEDCSDISDWTDGDDGTGDSAAAAGYFVLDTGANVGSHAKITRDIGTIPDKCTIYVYLSNSSDLGTHANGDYLEMEVDADNVRLMVRYCTDGFYVYDGADWNQVSTGNTDATAIYHFCVDFSTPESAKVTIANTFGGFSVLAYEADCSDTGTFTDGTTIFKMYSDTTAERDAVIPHIQVGTTATDVYSDTYYVFGSYSLDAVSECQFWVDDNADFDFTGGTWTVEARVMFPDVSSEAYHYIFYQTGGTGSLGGRVKSDGTINLYMNSGEVDLSTAVGVVEDGQWYHIAFVENADSYYIFVNGQLKAYACDAESDRPNDYTGRFLIASYNGYQFEGYIDEIRISDVARWTENFDVPILAYSTDTQVYAYLGSTLPIDGFKCYISTANTDAATMSVYEWTGSAWSAVSNISDGTSASSKSLAQTGWVTFDTTVSTSEAKLIDGAMLYWYQVIVSDASTGTALSEITLDIPFQGIKELWDGIERKIASFLVYSTVYSDYTMNVYDNEVDESDAASFVELDSLATGGQLEIGFTERMSGIRFYVLGGHSNTTTSAVTVSYWNGTAWTSVGTVTDGTIGGGASLGRTGEMTWNAPSESSEFRKKSPKGFPLYYYKLNFSAALSADVQVYYIAGIPAQKDVSKYSFTMPAFDRLFLVSDNKEKKNSAICSSTYTAQTFSGSDAYFFEFGDSDALTGGTEVYNVFESNLYRIALFFKDNETWLLSRDENGWRQDRLSETVGCPAPMTIKVISLESSNQTGSTGNVAIWQGADGIYISDGSYPVCVSGDISDVFNQASTTKINTSKVGDSCAFVDMTNHEYHWLWASGSSTTLDKEYVYDLKRGRWFVIDRGSGNDLQCGIIVTDTYGNPYNYGFIDTGYMERLEYGTSFDGTAIAHVFQFGDFFLGDDPLTETQITHCNLAMVAKNTTDQDVTLTQYVSSETSGFTMAYSPANASGRIANVIKRIQTEPAVYHSSKFSITTDDETPGFEPLYVNYFYNAIRDFTR